MIARKIIHIDMDAFYAAVEQRDFPQYRNKPVIVGGNPFSRGVVATCSYEARPYGVHSAMASSRAYRLCPEAIFVKPRFEAYKEVSSVIRKIFYDYTDQVEPLSLDEAYLDVSHAVKSGGSASLIAKEIKSRIRQETLLTSSAGVSYNKFLAKIASELNKPDGFCLIVPEQGEAFIENLPIQKFHGVGKATARKMRALGVATGKDLKALPLDILQQHFGKTAMYYYDIARGIDRRPVVNMRTSRSIGAETTFENDIIDYETACQHLDQLLVKAFHRIDGKNLSASTLTIKVKYHDFVQITRSRTLTQPYSDCGALISLIPELLKNTEVGYRAVRLLGVTLSSLREKSVQASTTNLQFDLFAAEECIC